jgi:hypothetical protein
VDEQLTISGQKAHINYKYYLFTYHILQFTVKLFDKEMVQQFVTDDLDKHQVYLQLAFAIGNFILPKHMIKTFTF